MSDQHYDDLPHMGGPGDPAAAKQGGGGFGKFFVICCVLLAAVGLFCGVGGYFFFQFGKKQRAMQYGSQLRGYLEDDAQKKRAKEAFDKFVVISNEGKVGFVAFGVLENRFNDSIMDGQVTDEEFGRLMELVDDINAKDGEINLQDYPSGR